MSRSLTFMSGRSSEYHCNQDLGSSRRPCRTHEASAAIQAWPTPGSVPRTVPVATATICEQAGPRHSENAPVPL